MAKRSFQISDVTIRNNSSGTSGSASSPSSGVSSQLTGSHQQQQQHASSQQNNSNSQATLAAQLVSQQLMMQNALGALAPQEIQAIASSIHQQSLQQLHQYAIFQQANSTSAPAQLPPHAQFFLQNQVSCEYYAFCVCVFFLFPLVTFANISEDPRSSSHPHRPFSVLTNYLRAR